MLLLLLSSCTTTVLANPPSDASTPIEVVANFDAGIAIDAAPVCEPFPYRVNWITCKPDEHEFGCYSGAPDIDGCVVGGQQGGQTGYCCPKQACVRAANLDRECSDAGSAFACPVTVDGHPLSDTNGCTQLLPFVERHYNVMCCE